MNPTRTKGRRQLTNLLGALQSPYRIRFWLKFAWGGRAPAWGPVGWRCPYPSLRPSTRSRGRTRQRRRQRKKHEQGR
jgi:hypothetical protein